MAGTDGPLATIMQNMLEQLGEVERRRTQVKKTLRQLARWGGLRILLGVDTDGVK